MNPIGATTTERVPARRPRRVIADVRLEPGHARRPTATLPDKVHSLPGAAVAVDQPIDLAQLHFVITCLRHGDRDDVRAVEQRWFGVRVTRARASATLRDIG